MEARIKEIYVHLLTKPTYVEAAFEEVHDSYFGKMKAKFDISYIIMALFVFEMLKCLAIILFKNLFLYCNFQQAIKFSVQKGGKCVISTNLWNILEIHQLSNISLQAIPRAQQECTEIIATTNFKVADINNVYWSLMHKSAHICLNVNLQSSPQMLMGTFACRKLICC